MSCSECASDETFCVYCQRRFASTATLHRHIHTVHAGSIRAESCPPDGTGPRKVCAVDECEASFADHAWGAIKVDGWFQQKDGTAWCPQHVPGWVAGWRARRDAGAS